ncbi:exodeoxyribonuclease III [Synechococcales cyanobacterium C]|uniref:Exodeoxyribonuclease III n=1 Tax=Petrachloros mirabilis ULC683 TaxID=2781853 RepID=A0A8K1ZVW6_9CYAN|nr:exodeoxyribonuclease III [Petrachloros mirabilis]NCJ05853.1 exodeoxyribonuclease III [Petrachloros mirabilis ULC683]
MKIATWNVNSIRMRLPHVLDWLDANPVDALCLQETKVVDADFPRSQFTELGYHLYIYGQKAYNGVALITPEPLGEVQNGFFPILGADLPLTAEALALDDQKRVISGLTSSGIRIVNLYVPNGSAVGSDKYNYKLRWFQALHQYLKILLKQSPQGIVVCGDFNIAPEDGDIHDPEGKANHIMASEAERAALQSMCALGFTDIFRHFTPETGHYTWWDYRAASFRRNLGWRIDHHYLSLPLVSKAIACTIDTTPRQLAKPSDHAPVILELQD